MDKNRMHVNLKVEKNEDDVEDNAKRKKT